MAYANFKPMIWSKFIQHELEKKTKLVDDCWMQFQGEAKKGESVKILGVGKVTIGDYTGADIGAPENVDDSSVLLPIDNAKFFNFAVDDVDKSQAIPGLMEALMEEATRAMALARDTAVANLAATPGLTASASAAVNTADAAKKAIDAGILYLRENDVDVSDDVVIEVAPFMYALLRDQLVNLKTDNDELIKKGIVGMYDNCRVKLCNNLYSDGTDTYMMIRTKKAIAFAGTVDKVEAYRPEGLFADAVKGLNVFGTRVIRPKEIYIIKARKK